MTQPLIVDSHCHLNFPDFAEDFNDILIRAEEAGVGVLQTICTHMEEFPAVRDLAAKYNNIYCSVGVHPCHVQEAPLVEIEDLMIATAHPKVIGVGETGLDYFHDRMYRSLQKESLLRHIIVARESNLPLIVHTRDADEDTVTIIREEHAKGPFPFLIHCFTASKWLAEEVLKLGGYISLSGILTFKNAKEIQETARELPLERILLETDAPYLAPAPHRGKRNEPAFTRHCCEFLADLKGISFEQTAQQTSENFFTLFQKAVRPA